MTRLPDAASLPEAARGLAALGSRWVAGGSIDWLQALYAGAPGRRVPLPTYPFERQSYWVEVDGLNGPRFAPLEELQAGTGSPRNWKVRREAMLKIVLLNMPFAAYHLPSIGLTQLKAVVDKQLGDRVETRIAYANIDFASSMGLELYESITSSGDHLQAGFPEWFFRAPRLPRRARQQPRSTSPATTRRTIQPPRPSCAAALEKRRGAGAMLDHLIDLYQLDQADLVGFTSMFFENLVAFATARKLKARNPKIVTVMGGATSESPVARSERAM